MMKKNDSSFGVVGMDVFLSDRFSPRVPIPTGCVLGARVCVCVLFGREQGVWTLQAKGIDLPADTESAMQSAAPTPTHMALSALVQRGFVRFVIRSAIFCPLSRTIYVGVLCPGAWEWVCVCVPAICTRKKCRIYLHSF